MKTKAALFVACVCLLVRGSRMAAAAEAIEPYIDDRTILVARLDLDRIDLEATQKWVETAGANADVPSKGPMARRDMEKIPAWITQFRKAGGKSLYWVVSFADVGSMSFYMAPLEPGSDAKALSEALTSLARATGESGRTQVIGQDVVAGDEPAMTELARFKPTSRPELARAFADAGDASIRLAIIPSPDVHRVLEALLPAEVAGVRVVAMLHALQWATLAIKLPPAPSVHVEIQCTDADAARAMADVWRQSVASARQGRVLEQVAMPEILPEMSDARVVQDKITLSMESEAVTKSAARIAAPFVAARRKAAINASMDNVKQILLASVIFANSRRDENFPDSLDEVLRTEDISAPVFDNPRDPTRHPGYVYIKPPSKKELKSADASRMMIYEAHDPDAEQIVVGYADGHAEVVNEVRFKKLLDEATANRAK